MKKITLLIPDKYSDILSATVVGVRYDNDSNSTTYLTTCNINLRDHDNDTYVVGDSGKDGWLDEVSIEE